MTIDWEKTAVKDLTSEQLLDIVRYYARGNRHFSVKTVDDACDYLWVTSLFMQMIARELETRHGYSNRKKRAAS